MKNIGKSSTLYMLRAYKWAISPMLPMACRYLPTCSDFAVEAVERYGVLRGGWKAAWRLLRCHPFVKGGYDPVVKPGVAKSPTLSLQNTEGRGRGTPSAHSEIGLCSH